MDGPVDMFLSMVVEQLLSVAKVYVLSKVVIFGGSYPRNYSTSSQVRRRADFAVGIFKREQVEC